METQDSPTTRLDHYIESMLPWAHGHPRKAIRDFVPAIIDQQTGCQAQLARRFGNQEAAARHCQVVDPAASLVRYSPPTRLPCLPHGTLREGARHDAIRGPHTRHKPPFPRRDHQPWGLALLSLPAEFPRRARAAL